MDDASIYEIVKEIQPLLIGRGPGKIFQFGPTGLAIDFGLRHQGYLFVSIDPSMPRLYLIKRRVRDLERQSTPLNQFGLTLRKELANTTARSITNERGDRLVRFHFDGQNELGERKTCTLVAQLTGRSANLVLLDEKQTIIQVARSIDTGGQQISEPYAPPAGGIPRLGRSTKLLDAIRSGEFSSPSESADAYFTSLLTQHARDAQANSARAQLRKKIVQQQKLLRQLELDLQSHASAEEQKRIGDLLLANLSEAKRRGNRVKLIDYFSEDAPTIEIDIDEWTSLKEEAQRRFAVYQRSKRARAQITSRITEVKKQLERLQSEQKQFEDQIARYDSPNTIGINVSVPGRIARGSRDDLKTELSSKAGRSAPANRIPGTRRYVSSDGFEILVGRTSKDNDHLTLKVAKPNDFWLHAADYGGSHVVVRNSTRKEIPQRTLIEAAQLAAFFSQAKKDPKVDVHYTQRKFVTKPKGAKPGLVRLQRFKNITVQPREAGTREQSKS